MEEKPSDYFVITRGWMNAQNRLNNYSKEAIDPDTCIHIHLTLSATTIQFLKDIHYH